MASKVSVVIPTYNDEERILRRSIQSSLNQTMQDISVTVVNDAPENNIDKLIESFDDSRLTHIEHNQNRGGSAARNTGAENSEAKYIAFLDSDDEWVPSKLERQIEYLESKPEEWIACYSNTESIRHGYTARIRNFISSSQFTSLGDNEPQSQFIHEGGKELVPHILKLQIATGGASTILIKRSEFNNIDGFDESFPRHQDLEFMIRVAKQGKIAYLDQKLVRKYESAPPSVKKVIRSKERYSEKFEADIAELPDGKEDYSEIHSRDLGKLYLSNGYLLSGLKCLKAGNGQIIPNIIPLAWRYTVGIKRRAVQSVLHKQRNQSRSIR